MQTQSLVPGGTPVWREDESASVTPTLMWIEADGSVVAIADVQNSQLGPAVVASVIAEELRVSADRIRIRPVKAATTMPDQLAQPSSANLRARAAAIRAYLLTLAGRYFGMDASELLLNDGQVLTFDGRAMAYQDLSREAAA